MGLFNVLTATSPVTGKEIRIQFKYGVTWQYEYRLGDRIELQATDAETTDFGGITEPPMSSDEAEYFQIKLHSGVLRGISPISEDAWDRLEA